MADCPPNLDDGEMWIPSDILPDIVSAKPVPEFPSQRTCMDAPAPKLPANALSERKQEQTSAKPPPNSHAEYFGPPTRSGPVVPPGSGYRGVGGGNHSPCPPGGFRPRYLPLYQYLPFIPAQPQVVNFAPPNARVLAVLQWQPNQFMPYWVNGQVMGGFIRESGGTGVFLPRISTTIDSRRNQSVNNGQKTVQGQNLKKVTLKKQEGVPPQAEKGGLLQDWTY